jgi:citronellyl-CoA dehydrogenase
MGDLGLLGRHKPEEYGGAGLDYSYSVVMAEALGNTRCGGVPMAIGVQTDMATPALARFGSDELRREFLAPAIAGDIRRLPRRLGGRAPAPTSPAITTARKDGGDYVINGGKMWITNGTQADWMCLLANTGEGRPHKNKSLIIIPMKTRRASRSAQDRQDRHARVGHRAVFFDDVRVPQRYRSARKAWAS